MCARRKPAPSSLEAPEAGQDLLSEIHMLRDAIQRINRMVREAEDIESTTKAVNSLGLALSRLASLLKSQQAIYGGESELARELNRVLDEVIEAQRNRPDEPAKEESHA